MNSEHPAEESAPHGRPPGRHRTRWVVALLAAAAVCVAGAAVWAYRIDRPENPDCSTIERLGHRWSELSDISQTGEDTPEDWRTFSADVREGAGSVSDSAMQAQLGRWADGIDTLADVKAENGRSGPYDTAREDRLTQRFIDAGNLMYASAGELYKVCGIQAPDR